MYCSLFLLVLLSLIFGQGSALAQNFPTLVVGSGDGSNGVPFGGLPYQDRYQQFIYPWVWGSDQKTVNIKTVSFSSNPLSGTGEGSFNLTLRLGVSDNLLPIADFSANLAKSTVVYNGPIKTKITGLPGDLKFEIKPFRYDPQEGKSLVIDIQIYSFSGFTASYRFGSSANTGRVYRNTVDGTVIVDQNNGLQVQFEFVPAGK